MDIVSDLLWSNMFSLLSWVIRIGALIVVPFRRSSAEARTWLLAFFIAPVLALVAYLAFGRPQHSKKRQALFAKLPDMLGRALTSSGIVRNAWEADVSSNNASVSSLATNLSQLPPLTGNCIELLPDYDDVIDRLVADIDAAGHHVHLEFYIFADDATGRKVMAALSRAGKRGVNCRVLIDAMGSFGFGKTTQRALEAAGVEVHRILPLARRWNASRIDLRNHRKIAVIDGRIGYTGSQNVVDAKVSAGFANQELMCRMQGPVVAALQTVFLGDWYLETEAELSGRELFDFDENAGDIALQVLPTGPDYEGGRVDMVFADMIYAARSEIVLATPYFIPNEALLQALKTAAIGNVEVTLLLSRKLDSWVVGNAQRSYYTELLEAGVNIRLFAPDFLHAKHIRIDHTVSLIGSSNMDMRSFELNAEISLLAYGERVARQLEAVERDFLAHTEPLSASEWGKRGIGRKVLENTARLASDLL